MRAPETNLDFIEAAADALLLAIISPRDDEISRAAATVIAAARRHDATDDGGEALLREILAVTIAKTQFAYLDALRKNEIKPRISGSAVGDTPMPEFKPETPAIAPDPPAKAATRVPPVSKSIPQIPHSTFSAASAAADGTPMPNLAPTTAARRARVG
jgi:hypothetical protein